MYIVIHCTVAEALHIRFSLLVQSLDVTIKIQYVTWYWLLQSTASSYIFWFIF